MQIHVARGGQTLGIFSPAEVRSRLKTEEFKLSDLAWTEGKTEWAALPTFTDLLPPADPAAPPPLLPQIPQIPPLPSRGSADATRSSQPASACTPTPEYYPPGARAGRSTSGAAIASLVCGILSITILPFLASIPAVICGHLAKSGIKKSPRRLKGRGLATAGLILGYLSLVFTFVAIALPVFGSVQSKSKQIKSLAQGKQIAVACRMYAVEHAGAFPPKLDDLVPTYLQDAQVLTCPLDPSVAIGYEYYGGKESDPPTNILLMSKAAGRRNERIVVYVDSSGKVVKDSSELPLHKSGLHPEAL